MSAFKGGANNLSPLKLQLTPDGESLSLVEWRASLGAETGAAHSRPILSRPTVPGTTISKVASVPVNGVGTTNGFVISQFDTAPSLPSAGTMTYSIPSFVSYQWQAPPREGLVVYDGNALLLYALAGAGGSWDGEMVFENL
jgi:hypothetical protein